MTTKSTYSIGQLCELAGVSRRTLQHYDDISLLKPTRRKDNGYREYTEADAMKLKQVLIYRALDFSTKEISQLLNAKNFDLFKSLKEQRELLAEKKADIESMMRNLDENLESMKAKTSRNLDILYEGIPKEKADHWKKAAESRVGSERWESNLQILGSMSEDEAKEFKQRGDVFYAAYADVLDQAISAPEVQELVAQFIAGINSLYASSITDFEELNYETCLEIARMSVEAEDVKQAYDFYGDGLAEHISEAITYYAEENLRRP